MDFMDAIKKEIEDRGCTQTWLVQKMNEANPSIALTPCKFSATMNRKRKMSADELLAFFKATGTKPDDLFRPST